jgi:hypothetical protein
VSPRSRIPGQIVVCGDAERNEKERLPNRDQTDTARSTNDGLPRAPNVSGLPDCSRGCIRVGKVPAPVYYFDITALPEPPKGPTPRRSPTARSRRPESAGLRRLFAENVHDQRGFGQAGRTFEQAQRFGNPAFRPFVGDHRDEDLPGARRIAGHAAPFWIMLSMETPASRIAAVISASTPGRSATVKRR